MLVTERMTCRSCGRATLAAPFLDLGNHAIADFDKEAPNWEYAPLSLCRCGWCGLVQLQHTVSRQRLFSKYWYRSGLSETMRDALRDAAQAGMEWSRIPSGALVLDIGANDGTLLNGFRGHCLYAGFEPADIPTDVSHIIRAPFSAERWRHERPRYFPSEADLIFSIAMFYSVEDPDMFVRDIASVLHKDGVWVLQMNDLLSLASGAYDIIGHEHVCYWSLYALRRLLERHKLRVVHIDRLPLNGGTARFIIEHVGGPHADDETVEQYALDEHRAFAREGGWVQDIEKSINDLHQTVRRIASEGKSIHIKGASTRGSTIVQSAMLDVPCIQVAADRDPAKWGKLFPGTTIPITSEQQSREMRPDYYLALPYSYINQFTAREHDFLARGGKFIVPVPEVQFVEGRYWQDGDPALTTRWSK